MSDILFNSDFAKNSKFEENFVGDILAIDEWLQLVSQFKNYYRQNHKLILPHHSFYS